MIRKLIGVAGLLMATAGVAQAAGWFNPSDGTQVVSLVKAHQAYVARDFSAMTKAVHEVLADSGADKVERKNALALISKAFAENKGRLPADWKLPANFDGFKFKHKRKELPDGIEYAYALAINGPEQDSVKSMKLVKFPNQVILDREAGIGEWSTEASDDSYYFEIYGGDVREPLEEGLYLFTLSLKDGTKVEGWFPLENLTSSAAPTVNSPEVGQTYTQGNPEVRWEDFRSPEYQSNERRILALDVGRVGGNDGGWTGVWSHYEQDPVRTSAVIGETPDSNGPEQLTDGKYWLNVGYYEQHTFGDLKLRRGSSTSRPFYVRSQP